MESRTKRNHTQNVNYIIQYVVLATTKQDVKGCLCCGWRWVCVHPHIHDINYTYFIRLSAVVGDSILFLGRRGRNRNEYLWYPVSAGSFDSIERRLCRVGRFIGELILGNTLELIRKRHRGINRTNDYSLDKGFN